MGQGSIVARQPAELHRRQLQIIARLGKRLGQAQTSLETELLNSRHRRRGEDKGPRDASCTGAPPIVSTARRAACDFARRSFTRRFGNSGGG